MSHLIELVQQYGIAFAFVNVLLLQAGLPVPAWPTLIVAGALAARSPFTLAELLGASVAASAIGNLAWYAAGRRLGGRVLKTLCRVSLSPDSCVRQTESIFERWGAPSLMFAKFVPGFASVATAMAGVVRIPLWRFVLFDAIGAALWAGAAIALGYLFRDAVNDVLAVLSDLGRIGIALLVAAFAGFVLVKWVQRQRFIRKLRMDRLTVAELKALLGSGEPITVIDVRSKLAQSVTGRIPGAITVDATNVRVDLLGIEPKHEVAVYCACPNEASAVKVAQALVQHGFKRVRPLTGGIDAWIEAGHEVER